MFDQLVAEYKKWCDNNNLPYTYSADELVVEDSIDLTGEQKEWLHNFIDRWEKYA